MHTYTYIVYIQRLGAPDASGSEVLGQADAVLPLYICTHIRTRIYTIYLYSIHTYAYTFIVYMHIRMYRYMWTYKDIYMCSLGRTRRERQ